MSVPAIRASLADAALRKRDGQNRRARRPRRRAIANALRWVLDRFKRAGRKLGEQVIDEAIDALVDAAIPAVDLGDSPFADDAEDVLRSALDREGRAWMHGIARDVWDDLDGDGGDR